jgi:aryl-alcohol dehydrogenase-like predicted oxidoreductase
VVGLGCNNFGGDRLDLEASRKVVHKALDLGITLIDRADVYGNGNRGECEEILGACLGERRKESSRARRLPGRWSSTPTPSTGI